MKNKTKLLEWVTAEDGEKNSKNDLQFYFKEMILNIIVRSIILFFIRDNL